MTTVKLIVIAVKHFILELVYRALHEASKDGEGEKTAVRLQLCLICAK